MSISTYAELQTALGNWLKRSNLTSYLPDLITLGESRLNRELRLLQMETSANVSLSSSAVTANLPTGFLDIITLHHNDTLEVLTKISVEQRQRIYASGTARPSQYAISGTFLFPNPADAAYTLPCRYYKKLDIASDLTNWLLTNHPGAYLFTALAEAELFIKNDKRLPIWQAKASEVIDSLNTLDSRARKSPLRVDDGLLSSGTYNIAADA